MTSTKLVHRTTPAIRRVTSVLHVAVAGSFLLVACGGDSFTSAPAAAGGSSAQGAAGPGGAGAAGGSSQGGASAKAGSAGEGGATTGGGTGAAGGAALGGSSGEGGSTSKGGATSAGGAGATAGAAGAGAAGKGAGGGGAGGNGTAGAGVAGGGTGGNGNGGSTSKPTLKDACAATNGAVLDPAGGHCYLDITSTQGVNAWNEGGAVTACGSDLAQAFPALQPFKTHLLEVEADTEQAFVTTAVVTSPDRDVWIHLECKTPPCACGMTCANHAWQWVDDSPPQYWDPTPDMMPWGVGGPTGAGKCAALTPTGALWIWSERQCDAYQFSGGPTGQSRYYRVVCEIE